jgi:hypothetical protein
MTSAPNPDVNPTCCGGGGTHARKAGEPLATSCLLCPRSASYWRLAENRADGQPYVDVAPLSEVSGVTQ